MTKYILEVDCKIKRAYNERYELHEKLGFERDNDSDAVKYAFSWESIDTIPEYKKLYKVLDPHGSTKRIYPEDQ